MDTGRDGLSLRERQKAQTHEHLLAVATALIAEKGFQATSIDDIARAAGSSRATVYSYFETKEAIMAHVIRNMWDETNDMYVDFGQLGEWTHNSIRGWVESLVKRFEADEQRNRAALMVSATTIITDYASEHQRHIDSLTMNKKLWRQHFRVSEVRGRASILISMLDAFMANWFLHRVDQSRDAAIDLVTNVWLDVLHVESPSTKRK